MLYDKRWETKPVKVPASKTKRLYDKRLTAPWRKVLLCAADIVDAGWCQRTSYRITRNGRDEHCVLGAIDKIGADVNLVWQARVRLTNALGFAIPVWNDAPGRTKAQVVAKLREVATS